MASCGADYPLLENIQFLVAEGALGSVESLQQELYDRRNPELHRVLHDGTGEEHQVVAPTRLGSLPDITLTYGRHCRLLRKLGARPGGVPTNT